MKMDLANSLLFAFFLAIGIPAGVFGQISSSPEFTVDRNLIFTTTPEKNLTLNLYRPASPAGKVPVVAMIYGGAWMMRFPQSQTRKAEWLARNGYAVAVIDYRLSSEAKFPAPLYDCKAAVRWIRANADKYHLDAAHIGAWGDSSGGHLASLLGVTAGITNLEGSGGNAGESSDVQAVVDFFGPADFVNIVSEKSVLAHGKSDSPEGLLIGGAIMDNIEKAKAASPVTYVTTNAAPFLIVHGDKDQLVPWEQSELFYEALNHAGADVTFYTIAGAGHEDPRFDSPMMRAAVKAFLDKHLKETSQN